MGSVRWESLRNVTNKGTGPYKKGVQSFIDLRKERSKKQVDSVVTPDGTGGINFDVGRVDLSVRWRR